MASELAKHLESQSPIFGLVGRTFDAIGGEPRMAEWADDNPGKFYMILMSTSPSVQPIASIQGNVTLHVHPSLAPTSLDVEKEINPDAVPQK